MLCVSPFVPLLIVYSTYTGLASKSINTHQHLQSVLYTHGNKGRKPDSHLVPKNDSAQASNATEGIKLVFKFGQSAPCSGWCHKLYNLHAIHKLACYWVARQVFSIGLIKIKKVKLTLAIFYCITTLYIEYCNAGIVFCYSFIVFFI